MEQECVVPSVVESQIMFGVIHDFSDVFSGLQITKQFCNDRATCIRQSNRFKAQFSHSLFVSHKYLTITPLNHNHADGWWTVINAQLADLLLKSEAAGVKFSKQESRWVIGWRPASWGSGCMCVHGNTGPSLKTPRHPPDPNGEQKLTKCVREVSLVRNSFRLLNKPRFAFHRAALPCIFFYMC